MSAARSRVRDARGPLLVLVLTRCAAALAFALPVEGFVTGATRAFAVGERALEIQDGLYLAELPREAGPLRMLGGAFALGVALFALWSLIPFAAVVASLGRATNGTRASFARGFDRFPRLVLTSGAAAVGLALLGALGTFAVAQLVAPFPKGSLAGVGVSIAGGCFALVPLAAFALFIDVTRVHVVLDEAPLLRIIGRAARTYREGFFRLFGRYVAIALAGTIIGGAVFALGPFAWRSDAVFGLIVALDLLAVAALVWLRAWLLAGIVDARARGELEPLHEGRGVE